MMHYLDNLSHSLRGVWWAFLVLLISGVALRLKTRIYFWVTRATVGVAAVIASWLCALPIAWVLLRWEGQTAYAVCMHNLLGLSVFHNADPRAIQVCSVAAEVLFPVVTILAGFAFYSHVRLRPYMRQVQAQAGPAPTPTNGV